MSTFLTELMTNDSVNLITELDGNEYGIRVLGGGTDLFFRENQKGLICAIDAADGVIYKKSVRIWDTTGEIMSMAEKERVTKLIERYYRQFYNPNVVLR